MKCASACLLTALLMGSPWLGSARAEESEASRAARWKDVAAILFGSRPLEDGSSMLALDAPPRALDAALVPVSIDYTGKAPIKTLYLVIDDNPAPLAAAFHFGPEADPHLIKTRVRVDQYTLMHAVIETADNHFYQSARFIKAAGGCSAPGTASQAEAMARLGRMKFFVRDPGGPGKPEVAELLISHPNFNGMQMDQVTRLYTPARYVQQVRVSQGGKLVFSMQGDISLSQDPSITFGFRSLPNTPVDVEVDDSAHTIFRQSFAADGNPS
jgi:sulfur-oxidizing protein SoxY